MPSPFVYKLITSGVVYLPKFILLIHLFLSVSIEIETKTTSLLCLKKFFTGTIVFWLKIAQAPQPVYQKSIKTTFPLKS